MSCQEQLINPQDGGSPQYLWLLVGWSLLILSILWYTSVANKKLANKKEKEVPGTPIGRCTLPSPEMYEWAPSRPCAVNRLMLSPQSPTRLGPIVQRRIRPSPVPGLVWARNPSGGTWGRTGRLSRNPPEWGI